METFCLIAQEPVSPRLECTHWRMRWCWITPWRRYIYAVVPLRLLCIFVALQVMVFSPTQKLRGCESTWNWLIYLKQGTLIAVFFLNIGSPHGCLQGWGGAPSGFSWSLAEADHLELNPFLEELRQDPWSHSPPCYRLIFNCCSILQRSKIFCLHLGWKAKIGCEKLLSFSKHTFLFARALRLGTLCSALNMTIIHVFSSSDCLLFVHFVLQIFLVTFLVMFDHRRFGIVGRLPAVLCLYFPSFF